MANILIVDDSPVMRSFVKRVLQLSGVGVGLLLEAGEGAQALVVLKEHPVHLVLTDINMPVMNGEQLVRAMRSDPLLDRFAELALPDPWIVAGAVAQVVIVCRVLERGFQLGAAFLEGVGHVLKED